MIIIKPNKICKGDSIGIVAPSRFVSDSKNEITKGIKYLENNSFEIILSKHFNSKFFSSAGTPSERAEDINSMFADNEIKAVICALGGDSANQVLNLLDYNLIKNNPKPFVGYSDNTNLDLAIFAKTGLITFHGPNALQLSDCSENSGQELIDLLTGIEVDINKDSKYKIIKEGKAKGKLLGGNLFIINCLCKTEYFPDFSGAILFWEDIDEGLGSIEFQLYQLKLTGILEIISGMVIGHIHAPNKKNQRNIDEIILELTKDYSYPIISVDNFGHQTKNFMTYPEGIEVDLNSNEHILKLIDTVVK